MSTLFARHIAKSVKSIIMLNIHDSFLKLMLLLYFLDEETEALGVEDSFSRKPHPDLGIRICILKRSQIIYVHINIWEILLYFRVLAHNPHTVPPPGGV